MRTIVTLLAAALRQSTTSTSTVRSSATTASTSLHFSSTSSFFPRGGLVPLSFQHHHHHHLAMSTSTRKSTSTSSDTNDCRKMTEEGEDESKKGNIYDYPLIDVDCNLIHSDLASLLPTSASTTTDSDSKFNSKYFNILHHPSTSQSNIRAMFVPSSTIDEAEEFHKVLSAQSDDADGDEDADRRNNIDLRMSVGIHPYHTGREEIGPCFEFDDCKTSTLDGEEDSNNSSSSNIQERIEALLKKDEQLQLRRYITCIGETGLDYSDGFPDREEQLPWFEFQLRLAKKYDMPLFIHERLAFDDTVRLLDSVFPVDSEIDDKEVEGTEEGCRDGSNTKIIRSPKVIIHCFTGKKEELKEYISRGYYISVSGYILKGGDGPNEINQCLKEGIIPLEKLMIETDAPYMGFKTCRETFYDIEGIINKDFQALKSKKKKSLIKGIYPNVPSSLPKVFEKVVESLNDGRIERGEDELGAEFVASCLYRNSQNFFQF